MSNINPNQSKKGKLCYGEVHPQFMNSLARVNEVSKLKGYEVLNWVRADVKCYYVSYLISATLRHIEKFLSGEDSNIEKDQDGNEITEPDVLHVECAGYNLLMLAVLFRAGRKDLDDRKLRPETDKFKYSGMGTVEEIIEGPYEKQDSPAAGPILCSRDWRNMELSNTWCTPTDSITDCLYCSGNK